MYIDVNSINVASTSLVVKAFGMSTTTRKPVWRNKEKELKNRKWHCSHFVLLANVWQILLI